MLPEIFFDVEWFILFDPFWSWLFIAVAGNDDTYLLELQNIVDRKWSLNNLDVYQNKNGQMWNLCGLKVYEIISGKPSS